MAENFTKYLVDYFKNKLSSGKDIKCKNCKKNKKFISQVNDKGSIDLQNEFLVFRRNGQMEVCVPDLIVVLDSETGLPIGTELLRYGQRIAVLGLPSHELLRTEKALQVIGPKAFGYQDLDFKPM